MALENTHYGIEKIEALTILLKESVVKLLNKGATTFLFGSMSEFDKLSWKIVTELKEKYPFIKRIYVRSAYPYLNEAYEEYILKSYEETYFPTKLEKGREIFLR